MLSSSPGALARRIEQLELRKETTADDISSTCPELDRLGVGALIVHSGNVPIAVSQLKGSSVKVGCVIGFPFGGDLPEVKAQEIEAATKHGASVFDVVLNSGAIRSARWESVEREAAVLRKAGGSSTLNGILECAFLEEDQQQKVCDILRSVGFHGVVNTTGFRLISTDPRSEGTAQPDSIAKLRRIAGSDMEVKARGGIDSWQDAIRLLKAGASWIGTSHAAEMVQSLLESGSAA